MNRNNTIWKIQIKAMICTVFRITFRTEPSDTPEEVTRDKIKRIKLSFVYGSEIRKMINEFSVEKYPEKTGV